MQGASKAPRALVLSALSLGTGSGLRAHYLVRALGRLGWNARLEVPGSGPLPYSVEMFLAAPRLFMAGFGGYDLVVAIKPNPNAYFGLAAARLSGGVCIVDVDDADGGYRGSTLARLIRVVQAPAFAVASLASTHHPLLKQGLVARLGADRVLDLAQGVDLEIFDPKTLRTRRAAWRREHGWQRSTLLAFTAHLNVACQMQTLLESLGPWLRRHPRAILVVAGSGPYEARCRKMAGPLGAQVQFLGKVSPREAAETLAASDCLVSAYGPAEGNRYRVPMKVGESLAMGLPVVTHLVPGLLPLKSFVFEASPGPEAFGVALNAALRGERARTLLGQDWVRRELDWTRVAQRFLAQVRGRRSLPRGAGES
jgi:Glycosyl transferases group 1